jgi:hypothetical protein
MPRFKVDVYYSGYITREVEANDSLEAKAAASEEAARFHNKREGDFADEIIPTLDQWPDASIAEIIE